MALSVPTFYAGLRVPASYLQTLSDGLLGLTASVTKTIDEPATNTSTLQDDDELFFAVPATSTYEWDALIIYQATTANDGKIAWTAPTGSTLDWTSDGIDIGVAGGATTALRNFEPRTLSDFAQTGGVGAGTSLAIRPRGRLVVGSTAGTFRMQFAQVVAGAATSMTVKAASYISYRRVA